MITVDSYYGLEMYVFAQLEKVLCATRGTLKIALENSFERKKIMCFIYSS